MLRHSALRSLSSEHHTGLAIARRARRAAQEGGSAQSVAWEDVKQRFRAELEGHFQREERGLLPVLRTLGQAELVERTLNDHQTLRALIAEDSPDNLGPFADLLVSHIRFEERALFDTAQRLIDAQMWAKVEHALKE